MKKIRNGAFINLRYFCIIFVIAFGLITLIGCSSSDDGVVPPPPSPTPTFNATGTWSINATKMFDSDGESIGEVDQSTMTITQTNNSITIETDDGDTLTGTVSGAIYTFSGDLGQIQEPGGQWGTATIEGTFELTSNTSLFGDYTFEWTDGSHIHTEEWDFTGTKQVLPPEQSGCGEGLPLTISDLSFPETVREGSIHNGSVTYQGTYEDIADPRMLSTMPYLGGTAITVPGSGPTVSNCSLDFMRSFPFGLSGNTTITFKLIDYDEDSSASFNWNNNAVSNELSQPITIQ